MLTTSAITTYSQAVESFVLSRQLAGVRPRTIGNYRQTLDALPSSWPPTPLEVQQWIAALQARGLQPSSIAYKLSVVRTLAKWAIDAGLLDRDPTRGMKHRVPKKAPRVPTQDEVKALLRACGRMRWTPGCA